MDSQIVIYIRSDVSWRELSEETYVDQERYSSAVIPISRAKKQLLLTKIKMWNRLFSISYFEYRQRLKEIAEWNRSRIKNIDIIIRNHHRYELLQHLENAVFIPVDDDDWFSPEIANQIRQVVMEKTDLVSWNDGVFCPLRQDPAPGNDHRRTRSLFPRSPHEEIFWTNGYAVSSRGYRRCPPEYQKMVLDRHSTALRTFHEQMKVVDVVHLDHRLAITHKSLASFTKMVQLETFSDFESKLAQLYQRTDLIPEDMMWAEPMIQQVDNLNQELVNSKKDRAQAESEFNELIRADAAPDHWLEAPLTRTKLINSIIAQFGYSSYLEIGCGNNQNFSAIHVDEKVGVDPCQGGTHRLTSDQFFEQNARRFDLIFVDGLHLEEQVLRDVDNSLSVLNEGGCILIHDCLPPQKVHQERQRATGIWMGDVWKAIVKLRMREDLDIAVLNGCCGMGVLLVRDNTERLTNLPELTWERFEAEKHTLLRLLEPEDLELFLEREPSLA